MRIIFLPVIYLLVNVCRAAFPVANIVPCAISDNNCIKDVINKLIKEHPNGIPELGFVQIDPYVVPKIEVLPAPFNPVSVTMKATDVKVTGFKSLVVKSVKGFTDKINGAKIEIKYSYDCTFAFDYDIDGNVLVIPIKGKGKGNAGIQNAEATFTFTLKVMKKDGKEFLVAEAEKTETKPAKMIFAFSGLFGGDKTLGDATNSFLNDHWKEIFPFASPIYNDELSKIFRTITNKVFAKIPYKELFKA